MVELGLHAMVWAGFPPETPFLKLDRNESDPTTGVVGRARVVALPTDMHLDGGAQRHSFDRAGGFCREHRYNHHLVDWGNSGSCGHMGFVRFWELGLHAMVVVVVFPQRLPC